MTSNSQHTSKLASVYTVGVYTTKSEDFSRLLSNLHIQHVFDVRNLSQQRAPARMNPAALSALAKDCGAIYYDMGETLGDKPNYQLFALSQDFSKAMHPLLELSKQSNILIVCAESDYRKCHRRFIASYLSRNGLPVHHLGKRIPTDFQPTLEVGMVARPLRRRIFTIGFTKKSMREFVDLLRTAKVGRLVDIRLRPVSQYSGFARKDDLEFLLELLGIQYIHTKDLAPTDEMLDSYRSLTNWAVYEHQFLGLLKERKPDELLDQLITPGTNVAFLCTEDLPDYCHRRLVAQYAKRLFPDLEVVHLTSRGLLRNDSVNVNPLLSR